jgi:hypothetical protein
MNIPFDEMPSTSRVWVYAANRKLTEAEQDEIIQRGQSFVTSWTAHQQQLKASFAILHNTFVVIAVDEQMNEVSGCGIDKSIHLMQEIDRAYNLNLFNRLQVELLLDNDVLLTNKQKTAVMLQEGTVNDQTKVFNKTVTTKAAFDSEFLIPLGRSWIFPQQQAS